MLINKELTFSNCNQILKKYNDPVMAETNKYYAIADHNETESGGIVYVFKKTFIRSKCVKQCIAVLKGKDYNLEFFGKQIAISANSSRLVVMSKYTIGEKKIENSMFVVFDLHDTEVIKISKNTPKFVEAGSNYGCSLAISSDGSIIAVGASKKENDSTTTCGGSIGAIYSFVFNKDYSFFKQHQLIRPPVTGFITDFGSVVNFKYNGNLLITGFNNHTQKVEIFNYINNVVDEKLSWKFKPKTLIDSILSKIMDKCRKTKVSDLSIF